MLNWLLDNSSSIWRHTTVKYLLSVPCKQPFRHPPLLLLFKLNSRAKFPGETPYPDFGLPPIPVTYTSTGIIKVSV